PDPVRGRAFSENRDRRLRRVAVARRARPRLRSSAGRTISNVSTGSATALWDVGPTHAARRWASGGGSGGAGGAANGGEQDLLVEGLAEVVDGPGETGALPGLGIVARGDEQHGNARALGGEALLQVEAAEPAQVHVDDQARELVPIGRAEERLGR